MPEAQRLHEAIKRQLKARGMRYRDLAQALGLSEPSVKRLLTRGGITLERLERICEVLETDFFELAHHGRRVAEQPNALTLAQGPRSSRSSASAKRRSCACWRAWIGSSCWSCNQRTGCD